MKRGEIARWPVLALLTLSVGCTSWSPKDPRLVSGPSPPRSDDPQATLDIAQAELERRVGAPFPDLTLIDRDGKVVRLSEFRGRRLAVLSAISSCSASVAWMEELESSGWSPPEGFDELVILIATGSDREWNRRVARSPRTYLVGWPLIDYLAYARWYPVMFGVSPDGRFEGYWQQAEQPAPRLGPLRTSSSGTGRRTTPPSSSRRRSTAPRADEPCRPRWASR